MAFDTEDRRWRFGETVPREVVQQEKQQHAETVEAGNEMVSYETLARLSVADFYMKKERLLFDRGLLDATRFNTAMDQLSMRMTLWQYFESQAKDFVATAKQYEEFLSSLPPADAARLRSVPSVAAWERQLMSSLQELKLQLPALQAMYRLQHIEQLLQMDANGTLSGRKLSVEDRTRMESTVANLRSRLPKKGEKLPAELEGIDIHEHSTTAEVGTAFSGLHQRIIKNIGAPVEVTVTGTRRTIKAKLPHALYTRVLAQYRMDLVADIRNKENVSPDDFQRFVAVQERIHDQAKAYVEDVLVTNVDTIELLATQNQLGPNAGGFELRGRNPEYTEQIVAFTEQFLLAENISDALKLEDLANHEEGLASYMTIITEDMANYRTMVKDFEAFITDTVEPQIGERLATLKVGVTKAAYAVPENTIGLFAPLGFDYLEWLGEREKYNNLDEVSKLMTMAVETQNLNMILANHIPDLKQLQENVTTDIGTLNALLKEFPPKNFQPGDPQYEEVRAKYATVLEALRTHVAEFAARQAVMTDEIKQNMEYHTGRMAVLENLDGASTPNLWIGLGLTTAELIALHQIGGRGGARSLPKYGRLLRPFKNPPPRTPIIGKYIHAAKGAVNAPGRVLNAFTRPITGAIDLQRWLRGKPLLPRVPYDKSRGALERETAKQGGIIAKRDQTIARQAAELEELRGNIDPEHAEQIRQGAAKESAYTRINRFYAKKTNLALKQAIDTSDRTITELQMELSEALREVYLRPGPESTALENNARGRLTREVQNNRAMRTQAARKMIGWRLPLRPSHADVLYDAHRIPLPPKVEPMTEAAEQLRRTALRAKRTKLLEAFSVDETEILMRSGLAGNMDEAIQNPNVRIGAELAEEGAERIVSRLTGEVAEQSSFLAHTGSRALSYAPVAIFGVIQSKVLYDDWKEYERYTAFQEEARTRMAGDLEAMVTKGVLTKKWNAEKNDYEYWFGDKVSICLSDVTTATDAGLNASKARLVTDIVGGGTAAAMLFLEASNPISWAAMGIEFAVHIGIDAWERSEYNEFVEHAPPWMLARFGGTAGALGTSEHELIDDTMLSDLLVSNKTPDVKKKLFFSMFIQSVSRTSPELFAEISQYAGGAPDAVDRMYAEDLEQKLMPVFMSHLLVNADRADLNLDTLMRYSISESTIAMVSESDMNASFRETADWYVNHLREREYIRAKKTYEESGDPMDAIRLYSSGTKYVFGRRLLDSDGAIASNGGKTRAELVSQRMFETLRTATGGKGWEDITDVTEEEGLFEFFNKHPGASYTDYTDAHGSFVQRPRIIRDILTGKKVESLAAHRFSHSRDFRFSVEGIAGIPATKEGEVWFTRSNLFEAYTPAIPSVEDVTTRGIDAEAADLYFDEFPAAISEVNELHASLIGRQKDLSDRYYSMMTKNKVVVEVEGKNRKIVYPNGGPVSEEELANFDKDLSSYMLDLQAFEGQLLYLTEAINAARKEADDLRREAMPNRGVGNFARAELHEELTSTVFESDTQIPMVFLAGDVPEDALNVASNYVIGNPSSYLQTKALFGMHVQRLSGEGDRFVATYMYAREPLRDLLPDPEPKDVYYVQIAFTKPQGVYEYTASLPLTSQKLDYIRNENDQNVLFETALEYIRADQQEEAKDIVVSMDRSGRIFRAGRNPDELREIERNLWGVRTKDNRFILIKRDPVSGELTYAVQKIGSEKNESAKEAAERWLAFMRSHKRTGSEHLEVELTDSQTEYAKWLEEELLTGENAEGQWSTLEADNPLVAKYNLGGSVSAFKAKTLPAEVLEHIERQQDTEAVGMALSVNPEVNTLPLQPQTRDYLDSHLTQLFNAVELSPNEYAKLRSDIFAQLQQALARRPNVSPQEIRSIIGEITRGIDDRGEYPQSLYEIESFVP